MAKIQNNDLVRGARGNFAKQFVYKKRGNNTHIARMPAVNKNGISTPAQAGLRERFSSASLYAKGAVSNPELKKEYQKKPSPGATAFNMALRDYFKPPVVKSIDPSNYDGNVGSGLIVSAKDDFRVVAVSVSIRTAAGVLLEEGAAQLNPVNLNQWIYTATVENAALAGTLITATASDLPGNSASLEISL